jgi:hypothetical protein
MGKGGTGCRESSLGGLDDAVDLRADAVDFRGVGGGGFGGKTEKSPALATPEAFTFATQFAITGSS